MMPRERMYDYMARRDGRRSMRRGDMARGRRDMRGGYDMGDYNRGGYSERDARRDYTSYSSSDYARGGRDYGDYARGRRDYGYDYGMGGDYLEPEEVEHWMKKLMEEVEDKDKPMLKMETIIKKAKDMGIEFDKFTPEEFHVAVLMVFTDYCKTLGTTNIDMYIRLAKDWLCDKDAELKYGEKLAAYHDYIVEGM